MLKTLLTSLSLVVGLLCQAAITVGGGRWVEIKPSATSGLESVFVTENASECQLIYSANSSAAASNVRWFSFNAMGGAYAEPINDVSVSGNTSSIQLKEGDSGYIVEADNRQTAIWVTDYSRHYPTLTSFSISPDSDCDRVVFSAEGGFDRITYYSINGAPTVLSREIKLEYQNLELQDADGQYDWKQVITVSLLNDIVGSFSVPAPLCNTQFTLFGDRFLELWGDPIAISSGYYEARKVEAKTWATQGERNNDNEQNASASSGLGGSAPVDITFYAVPTDAVMWGEWQFSTTEDFEDVENRFTDLIFTYTFRDAGTTYVRFMCADATGDCNYESETYVVNVGESKLLCPNAFSPQNEDGINDEWKVSYSSLISFDCHIFNRWGKELFHTTNPAVGWDGKVGGKFVPSGVYFYVIKAEGADGKKYNLSGDINIVGSKLRPTYSTEE